MLLHIRPAYEEGCSPSSLAHLARIVSCILTCRTSLWDADEGAVRPKHARMPTCSSALVPAAAVITKASPARHTRAASRLPVLLMPRLLQAERSSGACAHRQSVRAVGAALQPIKHIARRTLKLQGSVTSAAGRLSQCPQLCWQAPADKLRIRAREQQQ